jgi:alpha-D-ribose 1-methylphosphonate 5-triphosphate synthase subunit PhnH
VTAATRVQDHHRAFRAVLSAFSRPGLWFPLPAATAEAGLRLLLDALWGGAGTLPAGPAVLRAPSTGGALLTLPRGSEGRPEGGATAVYLPGEGATAVRLRGPGVDGTLATRLPIGRAELDDRAAACARWPLGIDLLFLDPAGQVAGLPRTTTVETGAEGAER